LRRWSESGSPAREKKPDFSAICCLITRTCGGETLNMPTTNPSSPARTSSDAELLARFAASADDPAFAELVRRYLPLVLAVTRRRLGGSSLAEDAAQQVFIALSRRICTVRTIPCLAAWLQKAAVYEAANLARTEQRHRRRSGIPRNVEAQAPRSRPQGPGGS
jgi:hypothetical protein